MDGCMWRKAVEVSLFLSVGRSCGTPPTRPSASSSFGKRKRKSELRKLKLFSTGHNVYSGPSSKSLTDLVSSKSRVQLRKIWKR